MTAVLPLVDVDVDLSKDVPCELTKPFACTHPAEWALRLVKPCGHGPFTLKFCDRHKDAIVQLVDSHRVHCIGCGSEVRISEVTAL